MMKKLKCFFVLEKSAVLLISLYQTYVKLEKDTVMEVRNQKTHSSQVRHLTEKSLLASC